VKIVASMARETDTDHIQAAEPAKKDGLWGYASLGSLFLVGALMVAAWNIEIPYLAYSPGPVSDAIDSVQAEAVPVYDPVGDLLMLTVVSQDVNVLEAVLAAFDPSVDLVRRQFVRAPDETDEEYRSRVLQQMSDSNFRSVFVALRHLGYDMVPVEVIVEQVLEGVPAEAVLRPGDSIVAVDGVAVSGAADLTPLVQGSSVGDILMITVMRGGEELDLAVELVEREDTPGVPMIGIILGEITDPRSRCRSGQATSADRRRD
jgi:Lon-like protease